MIINGKLLAEKIKHEIRLDAEKLPIRPGFGVLLVGAHPASRLYVELKCKAAAELGFYFEKIHLPSQAPLPKILRALKRLNASKKIHGIIVQIPLPRSISQDAISNAIAREKDIDCFHPNNVSALFLGKPFIVPPTAEADLVAIRSVDPRLAGKHAVIVGSGFFGRQTAAHLVNAGATVTMAHSRTRDLPALTRQADILVSAVGKPGCITKDMVKKDAIVIDVGITKKGSRILGDVAFDEVAPRVRAITPVPGGIGPLTVALLMKNVLKAARESLTK
ncbi:bifunctional 5,10-methylenetetrahydrofolate dehydrogenase/5,10-methenyltetrahydrofolate cyclohydrolase [Candidatus Uhrbacteria bacterium]|nr:bifunctional 5,10-methylenetetrahydrofolate dehydrogenase/5,10-methenyltetrahydrofolate cyclohydrolase [Candidatus Uhrbacteria bacterium]